MNAILSSDDPGDDSSTKRRVDEETTKDQTDAAAESEDPWCVTWSENGHASRAPWIAWHAKEATNDIRDAPDDVEEVTAWWPDGFSKQIPEILSLTWRERQKVRDNKRKGKILKERHFEGTHPRELLFIVIDRNDKLLENGERLIIVSLSYRAEAALHDDATRPMHHGPVPRVACRPCGDGLQRLSDARQHQAATQRHDCCARPVWKESVQKGPRSLQLSLPRWMRSMQRANWAVPRDFFFRDATRK